MINRAKDRQASRKPGGWGGRSWGPSELYSLPFLREAQGSDTFPSRLGPVTFSQPDHLGVHHDLHLVGRIP